MTLMNVTKVFGVACFASLLSGCAVMEIFAPKPNMNPDSWKPEIPAIAMPVSVAGSRPLRQDDQVQVIIRAGSAIALEIQDMVDGYGNITLPHLGEFRVGQLTTSEAERAIRQAYISSEYFTSPNVTLVCSTMIAPLQYFVTGSIRQKGGFQFREGITLWQAIVAAGDVTEFAGNTVKIIRNSVSKEYNLRKIKTGKVEDPILIPGDIIEVSESWL